MDASRPCGKFISEDFGIAASVNNCNSELEESYLKNEFGACNNAEATAEVLPATDVDDTLVTVEDSLGVEELGTVVDEVLHIQEGASSYVLNSGLEDLGTAGVLKIHEIQEGVSNHMSDSAVGETHHQKVQSMLPEWKTDSVAAVTVKVEKNLNKCATFPSSEKIVSVGMRAETSCTAAGQNFVKSQNPAYIRSLSMPTSRNLVSALKGSRERLGLPRMERMNVTWAPDVYDPPATSMSHTLRNHYQRPKSKKKDHKHRRKSKSTRGSGNEKKHHTNWRNTNNVDLLHLRLQVPAKRLPHEEDFDEMNLVEVATPGCSLPPSGGFDRSTVDVAAGVGLGSNNQDSKCGRSLFGASLDKLHLSATEAT